MSSASNAINSVLAAKSSAVQQQIAMALLAKSQAAVKQQGQAVAQMLEASAQVGKAIGKGEQLDLTA